MTTPTKSRYSIKLPDHSVVPTREGARLMGIIPSPELISIWDREEAKE